MRIFSTLNREEVLAKIKKYSYPGAGPLQSIVGSVDGNTFSLNQVHFYFPFFLFRPFFYGKVISSGTKSEIVGEYKVHLFTEVLVGSFWILNSVILVLLFLAMPTHPNISWQMMCLALALYGFFLYAPRYFWNAEQVSKLYITEFLEQCASDEKVTVKYARLDEGRIVLSRG